MSKRQYTLSELAKQLNATLNGDADCLITSIAPLESAQANQISFLEHSRFRKHLPSTQASAVVLSAEEVEHCTTNSLVVENPSMSRVVLSNLFLHKPAVNKGIHASAVIGKGCDIHPSVSIGAQCVIGDQVTIGENTVIHPGCVIGESTCIGANACFWPNVTIYHRCVLGQRVILHSGAVIGSDGFALANDKGVWSKIPQLGSVNIGDGVEIGANTTIDRGALDDTVIEEGVKIDNLVQIAHNVRIGAHTAIAGCVGIAGSATIGKHCMIGGQVGVTDHVTVCDQVIVTGKTMVSKSITEPGVYSSGTSLMPNHEWHKSVVRYRQLDDMARRLRKLEKKVNETK